MESQLTSAGAPWQDERIGGGEVPGARRSEDPMLGGKTVRFVVGAGAIALLAGCIRFDPPTSFTAGTATAEQVRRVWAVDVTGDGTADALVDTSAGTVRYEACGAGCFQRREQLVGTHLQAAADFDEDGVDDVVAGHRVYFGGPAAGARPAGLTATDSVALPVADTWSPGNERTAEVGDFNGDGHVDLLVARSYQSYYEAYDVVFGDGAGGFTAGPQLGVSGLLNLSGAAARVGDVDGDGRDDVVTYFPNSLTVNRIGKPSFSLGVEASESGGASSFAVGDIDLDGRADLARVQAGEVVFLRSTGSGFAPFPDYQTIPVTTPSSARVGLRDVDGDGALDVLLDEHSGTASWFGGTSDGGFPYGALTAPHRVDVRHDEAFGDVDGDGKLDVFTANGQPYAGVDLHRNTSTP